MCLCDRNHTLYSAIGDIISICAHTIKDNVELSQFLLSAFHSLWLYLCASSVYTYIKNYIKQPPHEKNLPFLCVSLFDTLWRWPGGGTLTSKPIHKTATPWKKLVIPLSFPSSILFGAAPARQQPETVFLTFMEPRNRFQGMNSASLCSLAGRYGASLFHGYDNPIPPWFLAPMDCMFKNSGSGIPPASNKCQLVINSFHIYKSPALTLSFHQLSAEAVIHSSLLKILFSNLNTLRRPASKITAGVPLLNFLLKIQCTWHFLSCHVCRIY